MGKKSAHEAPVRSPIPFHPQSNGEFIPRSPSRRDFDAAALFQRITEEKSKRLGISRREFAESACGTAAALFVINQVYGCTGKEAAAGAPVTPGSGAGGSMSCGPGCAGAGSGMAGSTAGSGGSAMGTSGAPGVGGAGFAVDAGMLEDMDAAMAMLGGDEFIFDVQTHSQAPKPPWTEADLCTFASDPTCIGPRVYFEEFFANSDTHVVCLSGVPATRANDPLDIAARQQMQEIIDQLEGSPRLLLHCNARPDLGAGEIELMQQDAETYDVAAWKVYPSTGAWRLDSEEVGQPFIARARELGVNIICAHRGLSGDAGGYQDFSSPIDLVLAAKTNPDMSFLAYHSGWESSIDENHPFDETNPNPTGIDRIVKAVLDNQIGNDGNVYAELGSTWFNLMRAPDAAAHVLGKLLKYLGPDRVVYGSDSLFNGAPQQQIVALRMFEIPQAMQEQYGYPALTAEIKRKILGLNAAAVYGVDPALVRPKITNDDLSQLRYARLEDPASVPMPQYRQYGPRTRREFFAFARWNGDAHGPQG
jgi:predicted TIM-barrel fold metal-dependent hydrolase